jgi:hypothetical protein
MSWIMAQSPSSVMMGTHSRLMANTLNYSLSQIHMILRKWMSSISSSYNDYIHRLRDLNSLVIPRLGFPFFKIFFSKFSFQNSKIRGRSELSGLQGNFGKNPRIFGGKVWPVCHTSWLPSLPWVLFYSVFSRCSLLIERSTFIL